MLKPQSIEYIKSMAERYEVEKFVHVEQDERLYTTNFRKVEGSRHT